MITPVVTVYPLKPLDPVEIQRNAAYFGRPYEVLSFSAKFPANDGFRLLVDTDGIHLTYLRFEARDKTYVEHLDFDFDGRRLLAQIKSVRHSMIRAIHEEFSALAQEGRISNWEESKKYFLALGFCLA